MNANALRHFVGVLFIALALNGRALDELAVGPIKLHPHFEFDATYDDNLTIAPDHQPGRTEQSVFYFTLSPGIQGFYGDKDRNFLSVDYTAQVLRFVDLSKEDNENHLVTALGRYEFTKLVLTADHSFEKVTGTSTEVGDRVEREQNITHANAEYTISSKTSFGLGYRQEFYNYLAPGLLDYSDLEGYARFYYKITPKTDLFGEIGVGFTDVSHGGSTALYEQLNGGVRGKITSKITGTIQAGYEYRDYTSPRLESSDNVVASLNLKADFTERTTAELTVSRKVNPSIVTPDNNYEATRAQLDLRQKAWKNKVTFLAGIAYENDEYQKRFTIAPGVLKGRQDDYYEFRAGVDYDITKNVLVGLLYQFHENRSTIKTLSFDQNVATVRALLHF